MRSRLAAWLLAAALALPSLAAGAEARAFWLTRWNATDAPSIRACLDGMAQLKANILFIQVLGDGMALYPSAVAPRSPLVAPGFDAIATAIAEGRRRGIEIHAWINVLNVWSGGLGQPADPRHLVRAHPEWAVVDSHGVSDIELVGTPDTLIFFCPAWAGLRDYLLRVVEEIASRYDVGGIHLDYLRFPVGRPRCFCPEHKRSFAARFGRSPVDGDPDFIESRFADITGLFGDIYSRAGAARPGITVSAALVSPSGRYYQDAKRILEAGSLDMAVPMIYTSDLGVFEEHARTFRESSGGRLVLSGITADGGVVGEEVALARSLKLAGQCLFAWSTLDQAGGSDLAAAYAAAAAVPPMPWKDGSRDTSPPLLAGVRAAGVLAKEATALWHSDEKTQGAVDYGLTASLGSRVSEAGYAFDHAVRLSGLKPSTTYHFRVASTDAAGNVSRSSLATFSTTADGPVEIAVDDGDASFSRSGPWSPGSSGGGYANDYLFSSDQAEETAWAQYRPYLPRAGRWEVAVWYVSGANRVRDARYTVVHAGGSEALFVDQRSGGGRWNVLGDYRFQDGDAGWVRLSNQASGGDAVVADAVRFRLLKADPIFLRGDANADGTYDVADPVAVLLDLFAGRRGEACRDALDADDSGGLNLNDAIFLLSLLFRDGRAPPPPYPAPGSDPTADALVDC